MSNNSKEYKDIIASLKDSIPIDDDWIKIIGDTDVSDKEKRSVLMWVNAFSLLIALLIHKKIITKDEANAVVYGSMAVTEKTLEEQAVRDRAKEKGAAGVI